MFNIKELGQKTLAQCQETGVAVNSTRISLPILDLDQDRLWIWYFLYNVDTGIAPHQVYEPFARVVVKLKTGEIAGVVPIADAPDNLLGQTDSGSLGDEQWEKLDSLLSAIAPFYVTGVRENIDCAAVAQFLDFYESACSTLLLPWYFAQSPMFFSWAQAVRALAQAGVSGLHGTNSTRSVDIQTQMQFSRRELWLLMSLFQSPASIDEQNPYSVPVSQFSPLMKTAADGLIARQYLEVTTNQTAIISSDIAFAGGICAHPDKLFLITCANEDTDVLESRFFSRNQDWIYDKFVETGHQLSVIDNADVIESIARQFYLVDQIAAPGTQCWLPQPVVVETRNVGLTDGIKAAQEILAGGIEDKATVASLAESLVNPIRTSSLVQLRFEDRVLRRQRGFNVIESRQGIWLLTPSVDQDGKETERIIAFPTGGAQVKERIKAVINFAAKGTSPANL